MLDPDVPQQTLERLFEQLGLGSQDDEIQKFIVKHSPLASATSLSDAEFWNESQAQFIRESIAQDADWVLPIGKLDALLRGNP